MRNQNSQAPPLNSEEVLLVETYASRSEGKRRLPVIALALTSVGLGLSVLLAVLVGFRLISVAWNAVALPQIALFGLLPLSLTGLVTSIVSFVYHRNRASIVGVVLGVLGTVASLFAFILVVATAMAGHPV